MAIFGPEFNKELQQESTARKELVGQTEAMANKIDATTNAIGEYNQKIQENENAMEGLDKRTKEFKNLVAQNIELAEDRGELLKQRDEEKEEKAGLEELTPTFKDMQKSLFRISDAELERRQEFDKTVQLQDKYSTITVQVKYNTITVQLQYKYSTNTIQLQYNYSTVQYSTVP